MLEGKFWPALGALLGGVERLYGVLWNERQE